jgi:ferrochelatase
MHENAHRPNAAREAQAAQRRGSVARAGPNAAREAQAVQRRASAADGAQRGGVFEAERSVAKDGAQAARSEPQASGESQTTGVLLAQLGTPASPAVRDVRRYLREFLSDPRVIDLPVPARWLLVNAPFRAPKSARAYRAVWTAQGSPLLVHSRAFAEALQRELGAGHRVALGMRYGAPSLGDALAELSAAGVSRIVAFPLYPQVAESSSGSAIAAIREAATLRAGNPPLSFVQAFFANEGFAGAVAQDTRAAMERERCDHLLLSYHGLPERHVRAADPTHAHCLAPPGCCDAPPAAVLASCYRAQCFATTRAVARALALPSERVTTAFQSRLGRDPWIKPWTDEELPRLASRGVKRLAVACPSFVADCLETLEEVGIRARAQWLALGGEELVLVPCVNASPTWVEAAAELVRRSRA